MTMMLAANERWLILAKAYEEAQRLHHETLNPAIAIPLVEFNWDLNLGRLPHLEHYLQCVLAGLNKGVPKQHSLNKIQELRQETTENPPAWLEIIYQAYWKYTDMNPETPEKTHMVNMTFHWTKHP